MRSAAVLACLLAAVPAGAAVRMDVLGGLWRDDFTDLAGLTVNQQGALAAPSGWSIDSKVQLWSQPYSSTGFFETFTGSPVTLSPGIAVQNQGSSAETLTLFSNVYIPGQELDYCRNCYPRSAATCKFDPSAPNHFQNGDTTLEPIPGPVPSFPDYNPPPAIGNVPYRGTQRLGGVAWDTTMQLSCVPPQFWWVPGTPCKAGEADFTRYTCLPAPFDTSGSTFSEAIAGCPGQPLLSGANERDLVAGLGYSASFLVSAKLTANHIGHTTEPYLLYQLYENKTDKAYAGTTLYEGDFVGPNEGQEFGQMTPVTISVDPLPKITNARWDPQVFAQATAAGVGGHAHCTWMGPAWITANRGTVTSRVFDTLSDRTRWLEICWNADMSTTFVDSAKSPIPAGSPLTPVRLGYAVSNVSAPVMPVTFTVTHGGEDVAGVIGLNMVQNACNPMHDLAGAPVTGRYFQWSATLYGRAGAAELDGDLDPAPKPIYFGALVPFLRNVSVRYLVCAARATSRRIAPTSIRSWTTLSWIVDKPSPGCLVEVDVLDPDGTVLLANASPVASLAGIGAWQHPSLILRARLESDPADCDLKPVLRAWQVTWDPLADILTLACNGIRPALGESCQMQLRVDRAGPARLEVHDAAGQRVRTLVDAPVPAEARLVAWDGRNDRGEIVSAGVYFVVARVPGGRLVKRLAVIR